MKPTPRKPHRDLVGYVAERRNLLTKGHNIILDCKRADLEGFPLVDDWRAEGGRYQVICNEHSTIVVCTSLPAARSSMKNSTNFCDDCRALEAQGAVSGSGERS
jgi:hypothetical protein